MTEKEKLYTAKLYIEKLANGMNPLDDSSLPDTDLMNNVNICRVLLYVSDLLDRIIANNGMVGHLPNRKKEPFFLTEEQRAEIEISEEPVGISVLVDRVARVLDGHVRNVPAVYITAWLEKNGLLMSVVENGTRVRIATEEGSVLGIETREAPSRNGGMYKRNVYNASAQSFIIANLETIEEDQRRIRGQKTESA